jgi:hypothetical protein
MGKYIISKLFLNFIIFYSSFQIVFIIYIYCNIKILIIVIVPLLYQELYEFQDCGNLLFRPSNLPVFLINLQNLSFII